MPENLLDEIKYGNPSREDYHNMRRDGYLDKILPSLAKFTPLKNSSEGTKLELNQLMEYAAKAETGNEKVFDQSLVPFIQDLFIKKDADVDHVMKVTQDIVDDVIPIITKLKYMFQRPRPFQLAYYMKLKLFPDYSYFVSSPSYPSGHTTLGTVICHVLGHHYPTVFDEMRALVAQVQESRLLLGVHYPSDNRMAIQTAREIVSNPFFIAKYKL